MSAVYDYETMPKNDPMVNVVGRALKLAVEEVRPEVAAFFSVFPFCTLSTSSPNVLLMYHLVLSLPSWVPGMGIHRKAAQSREWSKEWVDTPFEDVLVKMVSSIASSSTHLETLFQKEGKAGPSMVSDALNRMRADGSDEAAYLLQAIKEASATAFGGEDCIWYGAYCFDFDTAYLTAASETVSISVTNT